MKYIISQTAAYVILVSVSFMLLASVAFAQVQSTSVQADRVVGVSARDSLSDDKDNDCDGTGTCVADEVAGTGQDDDCNGDTCSPELISVCTMDAKVCPDGSSVGRSGPKCEFAACPGEDPEASRIYLKIDDVKGESNRRDTDSDSDGFGDISDRLDDDDDGDSIKTEDESNRPSEIVVVGSQIREAIARGEEVRGWDPVKKEVIIKVEEIKNYDTLSVYGGALMADNGEIHSVSVRERGITINTSRYVGLFGFIPIKMDEEIIVSTDADIENPVMIQSPWWSFLARKEVSTDEIKEAIIFELEEGSKGGTAVGKAFEVREIQTLGNVLSSIASAFSGK